MTNFGGSELSLTPVSSNISRDAVCCAEESSTSTCPPGSNRLQCDPLLRDWLLRPRTIYGTIVLES